MADRIKVKSKKDSNQNVQVVVRLRPINEYEKADLARTVVQVSEPSRCVSVKDKVGTKTFSTFDKVYGPKSKQAEIYRDVAEELIGEVLQGYNCTVFAYGQTGTGKTYTMEGEHDPGGDYSWQNDPKAGIIPRSMHHLFSELEKQEAEEFSVRVSYVELYNEELFDLLGAADLEQAKLRIYEDPMRKGSVVINGMEEIAVRSREEVYKVLRRGTERRKTATTLLNLNSSRSHSVFTITVVVRENTLNGEELLKQGKLHLVDLAGSECIGRSGAMDKRAREAGNINQSLLTLGRVITCLTSNALHVPYRESKLTRLLQDSLGGRTITTIVATISPASTCLEETLSTLEYAQRAKNIKNHPEINQKLSRRALLKDYNDEIERLRKDLLAARDKNGVFLAVENYENMQARLTVQEEKIDELEGQLTGVLNNLQNLVEDTEMMDNQYQRAWKHLQEANAKLQRRRIESHHLAQQLSTTTDALMETQFFLKTSQDACAELHEQAVQCHKVCCEATSDLTASQNKLDTFHRVQEDNLVQLTEFDKSATILTGKCSQVTRAARQTASEFEQTADLTIANLNMKTEAFSETISGQLKQFNDNLTTSHNQLLQMIHSTTKEASNTSKTFSVSIMKSLEEFEGKVEVMSEEVKAGLKSIMESASLMSEYCSQLQTINTQFREENDLLIVENVAQRASASEKTRAFTQEFIAKMSEQLREYGEKMDSEAREGGILDERLRTGTSRLLDWHRDGSVPLISQCQQHISLVSNKGQQLAINNQHKSDHLSRDVQSNMAVVDDFQKGLSSRLTEDLEKQQTFVAEAVSVKEASVSELIKLIDIHQTKATAFSEQLQQLLRRQQAQSKQSLADIDANLVELNAVVTSVEKEIKTVPATGEEQRKTFSYPGQLIGVPTERSMRNQYEMDRPPSENVARYRVRESILDPDASLLLSPDALKSTLPSTLRANTSLPKISENDILTTGKNEEKVGKPGGVKKSRRHV